MASTGDQIFFLPLADAALTCAQEGQSLAQASTISENSHHHHQRLPIRKATSYDDNTTGFPNSNEEPMAGSKSDADKDEQNATTVTNASSSVQAQRSQAGSSRGSTAINRATRPVDATEIPARTRNRRNPAPLRTDPGPQRTATTSQARKRRNTGFDRATREGLTEQCCVVTPAVATPVVRHTETGNFHCPRCNGRHMHKLSVTRHFPGCVTEYGNPNGLSWWDHDTPKVSREYLNRQVVEAEEEDQAEGEEDEEKMSRSRRTRTYKQRKNSRLCPH